MGTDTGIRVRRHRYTSSQTPVYEFIDTGIRVHRHRYTSSRHRYTSSTTPVYEFADTGIRVHRHRKRESFAILGDLKLEIENFGNMGGLRIPPRYGIKKKKKIQKTCVAVPLKQLFKYDSS